MRGVSQLIASSTGGSTRATPREQSRLSVFLLLAAIFCLTLVSYSPVFFNFFLGDDFVHLTWLPQAIQNPELIWRNFHSSWLDGTTTRFYRPLISVFMVSDYLIWGVNGLGFRLTNLAFHLAGTVFLFLTVKELTAKQPSHKNSVAGSSDKSEDKFKASDSSEAEGRQMPSPREANTWSKEFACGLSGCLRQNSWAAGSAAIFALHPLHPEAVSWVTGRVDSVVTAFCLAAVFSYIRWRNSRSRVAFLFALIAMALGLLSKEMAITLPAVFLAYEVLVALPATERRSAIASSILATSPFWLLLLSYFVLRYFALGTVVGGYDDSLLFIANIKSFALNWLHGLRMTIVPINKSLTGCHSLLTRSWEALTVTAVLALTYTAVRHKASRPPLIFALAWLVLSLLPVYKIFAIADDLQGSRLAYLATAPLSVLLAGGFFAGCTSLSPKLSKLRAAAGVLFILVSSFALWTNNQSWRAAGEESNAIRAALSKLYAMLPGDPQVLLIALPDHRRGAYLCRNALWGMTKRPQMERDINNCLMLNPFEPILPFGFLKDSIERNSSQIRMYLWDQEKADFAPIQLPARKSPGKLPVWKGESLSQALTPLPSSQTKYSFGSSGCLRVISEDKAPAPELLMGDGGLSCWDIDFIELTATLNRISGRGLCAGADLLYANDIHPDFALANRAHASFKPGVKEQKLIFALHGLPEWSLGGRVHGLKLLLPPGADMEIKSVAFLPPSQVMPLLNFKNSGYLGTKGYLHISPGSALRELSISASAIPGCTSTQCEITRANLLFEEQNSQSPSSVAMPPLPAPKEGTIALPSSKLKAAGIYELRVFARSCSGERLGVASDHIVIAVEK